MKEIPNFLSKDECDYLIDIIKKNNHKSKVVGVEGKDIYEKSRTSSTSNLPSNDAIVNKIHNKIASFIGLPMSRGESLQGQMYEPGQYFKPHNDAFGENSYKAHCLHSGNRTNTLMIYLNDDFIGGQTNFPNLNKKIQPKLGKAVTWENLDENKKPLNSALHEGCEVESGIKYIITSWWREGDWNGNNDLKLFNENIEYKDFNELPKLTQSGFKVTNAPSNIFGIIKDAYNLIKDKSTEEHFSNKDFFIPGTNDIISLDFVPNIKNEIHKQLKVFHENFAKTKIEPSAIYGIRSYKNGNTLAMHRDRIATHHVSSIIIVDKDLNGQKDWALDFVDHDNIEHKLYLEPGQMVYYESARCLHGRKDPFQGNFYNNMFVHYKIDRSSL